MSITVYPYKLTHSELEARLEPGLTVLPGQLLRMSGQEEGAKGAVYGQVKEVRALSALGPGMPDGYGVLIELLHGSPLLKPQKVTLLSPRQMAQEVQRLQGPCREPLRLHGSFTGELSNLGALTIIQGDDFVLKFDVLMMLVEAIQPHRKLLIIDPLGIFEEEDGVTYLKAGRDVRLSSQAVGAKRFLTAFGELFSAGLSERILRVVAEKWPTTTEFVGFHQWLNLEGADKWSLKNLIEQQYQEVIQQGVFAETPAQVFDWQQVKNQAITVLDVSELAAPWKGLFYQEVVRQLFESEETDVVPVLLAAENYLPDLPHWVQQADETERHLLAVASPFMPEAWVEQAQNRFWVESAANVSVQGRLTLGLPLSLALVASDEQMGEAAALQSSEPTYLSGSGYTEIRLAQGQSQSTAAYPAPEDMVWEVTRHAGSVQKPNLEVAMPEWEEDAEEVAQLESAVKAGVPSPTLKPDSLGADQPLIVDLAAPDPEPTLSFLTAEQLSELLASTNVSAEEEPAQIANSGEKKPSLPELFLEGKEVLVEDDTVQDVDASFSSFNVENSVAQEKMPSPARSPKSASMGVVEEVRDFVFENTPGAAEPTLFEEAGASPPPFPTPEEYARDEFLFDVNLDQHADALSTVRSVAQSVSLENPLAGNLPETVSKSLAEFDALDQDLQAQDLELSLEPAWELSPQAMQGERHQPSAQPAQEQNSAVPMATLGVQAPAVRPNDAEMQEALDLIFPPQFTQSEEERAQPSPAEEPVLILQKTEVAEIEAQSEFQVGERVSHPSYGNGVVQKIIPMEQSVILNITFDTVGKRLLDPALCQLSRASS